MSLEISVIASRVDLSLIKEVIRKECVTTSSWCADVEYGEPRRFSFRIKSQTRSALFCSFVTRVWSRAWERRSLVIQSVSLVPPLRSLATVQPTKRARIDRKTRSLVQPRRCRIFVEELIIIVVVRVCDLKHESEIDHIVCFVVALSFQFLLMVTTESMHIARTNK